MLLEQPIDIYLVKTLDLTDVLNEVDKIIENSAFDEDIQSILRFKRELLLLKYYFRWDHSKMWVNLNDVYLNNYRILSSTNLLIYIEMKALMKFFWSLRNQKV